MRNGVAGLRARNVTMEGLADILWVTTSRIVVDKTGIAGRFDVDMKMSPGDGGLRGYGDERSAAG